eukprot:520177_1
MNSIVQSSMNKIIPRFGKSIPLYSTAAVLLGVGFYQYHSAVLAVKPDYEKLRCCIRNNNARFIDNNSLFHDYASSANTNNALSRITIPSGKATLINYGPILKSNESKSYHIIITIEGEGEIRYTPTNEIEHDIMYGNGNNIMHKKLTSGASVGIPQNKWHQIINKHDSKDLVLVVTSVPSK